MREANQKSRPYRAFLCGAFQWWSLLAVVIAHLFIGSGNLSAAFELYGDALYVHPSFCDLQYAIFDPRKYTAAENTPPDSTFQVDPEGRSESIKPHYRGGFRLGLSWVFCGGKHDVRGLYTWLHTRDRKVRTPDVIIVDDRVDPPITFLSGIWASRAELVDPAIGSPPIFVKTIMYSPDESNSILGELPAQVQATAHFDYDALDLQLGLRCRWMPKLWTRTYLAAHLVSLRHRFDVEYQGTLNPGVAVGVVPQLGSQVFLGSFHRSSNTWAVGPKIGFEAAYDLRCQFGLGCRMGAGVVAGENHYHHRTKNGSTTTGMEFVPVFSEVTGDVDQKGHTSIVSPFFEARAGVNYTFCCGDSFVAIAELGYEVIFYRSLLGTSPRFALDHSIQGLRCAALGIDGFYLSVIVQF